MKRNIVLIEESRNFVGIGELETMLASFQRNFGNQRFFGCKESKITVLDGVVSLDAQTMTEIRTAFEKNLTTERAVEVVNNISSIMDSISTPKQKKLAIQKVYNGLGTIIVAHEKKGFFDMLFHLIKYYREYKAIETAKQALLNSGKAYEQEINEYLDVVREFDEAKKSGAEITGGYAKEIVGFHRKN